MKLLVVILLMLILGCASATLPDGTKMETVGKGEVVVFVERFDAPIIPFNGRVVSEVKGFFKTCPLLRRRFYDEQDRLIKEEYLPICKAYVKSDLGIIGVLESLITYLGVGAI
jgi:hypothetical protein